MHIGFITPEYQYKNNQKAIGGIATFIKSLSEQLVLNKHTVSIFLYSQNETKTFKENGITVYLIAQKKSPFLTWLTNRKHTQNYINKIVADNNIDVLEASDWTGFTAFMKFNIPLVLRLHGSDTYFCNLDNRKVKFKNFYFENKALKGADKIVGVSQFVAEKTKELFNIKKEIKVIHNAMDTELFQPNHQNIQKKTLLYFGTIIRKKGVLEIANVFNKLVAQDSEIQLTFLGRDTVDILKKESTLKLFKTELSEKAKKNFRYISSVPYYEVKKYINQSEIIVLPSFAEAFPMTWLEAMALEKKLITSNIGWAKELMINGETGFMVDPKNHNEFVDKILSLLNDTNSKLMAENARKRIISTFNLLDKTKENIEFYKELL
ncbi:hypothetical protein LPB136_04655 [Tenacibaculum todarodis]|uniref:Glycoside hydrolase n=1 Tax=Tenacibaculum todarodis TaxID=1850252 RepID=A0A1L3JHZ3_9FLAO|nr:glycosyltransferase family 4 protein [Tenacibaculum todarodis]APG64693.1 hypothetical protein LPB136_04655 [Tenacibaculum todarodis]